MQIFIPFLIFYLLFFRFYIPNPLAAFIVFYFLYTIVDRQFVSLPDAFKPFKNRSKVKRLKDEIKLNPANANAYYELGQIYLEQKKYQASIDCFSKTLDKMGEYGEVYFYLGKALFHKGNEEEGIINISKAIEKDHKIGYGEPYVYLLKAELEKDNNQEQIEELVSSINKFGTPEIFYKAGIRIKALNKEMAKEMFKLALESYSGTPKHFKRTHRRWAILARLQMLF